MLWQRRDGHSRDVTPLVPSTGGQVAPGRLRAEKVLSALPVSRAPLTNWGSMMGVGGTVEPEAHRGDLARVPANQGEIRQHASWTLMTPRDAGDSTKPALHADPKTLLSDSGPWRHHSCLPALHHTHCFNTEQQAVLLGREAPMWVTVSPAHCGDAGPSVFISKTR